MKTHARFFLCALIVLGAFDRAYGGAAQLTLNLEAGILNNQASNGTALANGDLFLLVANTNNAGNDTFAPGLAFTLNGTPGGNSIWGQTWGAAGSGDVIIWAGSVNGYLGHPGLLETSITDLALDNDGWSVGDDLGLFWFNGTTYNPSGTTTVAAGQNYGYFTSVAESNGNWTTTAGPTQTLDFFTPQASGTDTPTGFSTISVVPEPSVYALVGGTAALGWATLRRRRRNRA